MDKHLDREQIENAIRNLTRLLDLIEELGEEKIDEVVLTRNSSVITVQEIEQRLNKKGDSK